MCRPNVDLTSMLTPELTAAAVEVARLLADQRLKLVLAESCTAGLAAAALGGIPGISNWFCGSAVVYRTETKVAWLGVDPRGFLAPEPDSVGSRTSNKLVEALLANTPEADIAAAITGHLGPNAPSELDGRCFGFIQSTHPFAYRPLQRDWKLPATSEDPLEMRRHRQQEAATHFLRLIAEFLGDSRSES